MVAQYGVSNMKKFKPPVVRDGFLYGTDWNTRKHIMIGVHAILKVTIDCGNNPPANRVTFIDGHMPHIDIVAEPIDG
jgi:hypothetical protein